jgi:hypothetical protein
MEIAQIIKEEPAKRPVTTELGVGDGPEYAEIVRVTPDSFHFTSRTPPVQRIGVESASKEWNKMY